MSRNLISKEYMIRMEGFHIHAKLDLPEKAEGKIPVLILQHGLTGHMEEDHIIGVAQTAVRAGYACLRTELYGHGKSDGIFCDHTVAEWVRELLFVIDHVKQMEFVSDIWLGGHSQGGLAIILAAALRADEIRGILPLSAAVNIVYGCREGNMLGYQFDPEQVPERLALWDDNYITADYVKTAAKLPVEEAVKEYQGPVLLIHGTEDSTVPYHYSEELQRQYAQAELVLVDGDDHCYKRHLNQVLDAVYHFLNK